MENKTQKTRCDWAQKSQIEQIYHDNEWGKIIKDDAKLFEMLILESFQAGLSWHCILTKREAMRTAFDGFDAQKMACYDEAQTAKFMQNEKLIRNRLKLNSLSVNANAFLAVVREFGSFYAYIWGFVGGKQIINHYKTQNQIPATTELSDRVAKDMKKRGFKFLGSTSVYAFLQSVGVVDDHLDSCFCKARS